MRIEQTLHGYRDGHDLLASSINLSATDARTMRVLSDMSGNMSINGINKYIKGYPLINNKLYVIAATWYACEMERPGCVWTHSILISFEDTCKIINWERLFEIFKKPNIEEGFNGYNESINIDNSSLSDKKNSPISTLNEDYCYTLVDSYFSNEIKPLVIKDTKNTNNTNYILSFWSILPYNERNKFTFCSVVSEIIQGTNFSPDIQCVNFNNRKIIDRSKYHYIDFSEIKDSNKKEIKEDINFITSLMLTPTTSYSTFLQNFSKDIEAGRKNSLSIYKVYKRLGLNGNNLSEKEIVDFLSSYLPNQSEGRKLKWALLNNNNLNNIFDEGKLLFSLLSSSHLSAFQLEDLNFEKRLFQYIQKSPIDSIKYLSKIITSQDILPNDLYKILNLLCKYITPEVISIMNKNYRELLSIFVRLKPEIATNIEYWNINNELVYENFKYLVNEKNAEIDWKEITFILLENNIQLNSQLLLNYIQDIPTYIIDWANQYNKEINNEWLNVLKESKSYIVKWLKTNEVLEKKLFITLVNILDPNEKISLSISPAKWVDLIKNNNFDFSSHTKDEERVNFFLTAISLNFSINKAIELLQISFEYTYNCISKDKQHFSNWELLDKHTPDLIFHNWDKCQKLRIVIAEKLIQEQLDPKILKKFITNKEIRAEFQKQYKKSKKGGFFKQIFG